MWARDEWWFWKGSLSDADIYPRLRNIVSGFLEIHLRSNLKEENRRRGRNWWTITDSSHNKNPVKEQRGHHLTALQMTPMVLKWTMGPHPITKAPIKFSAVHLAWQVPPEEEGLWMREARVKAQVGGGVGIYFHLNTPNTVPDSWKDIVILNYVYPAPDFRLWHSSHEKSEAYTTWSKCKSQHENRTWARSKYFEYLIEHITRQTEHSHSSRCSLG